MFDRISKLNKKEIYEVCSVLLCIFTYDTNAWDRMVGIYSFLIRMVGIYSFLMRWQMKKPNNIIAPCHSFPHKKPVFLDWMKKKYMKFVFFFCASLHIAITHGII